MKTSLLFVFSLFLLAQISTAQYVTIPDATFRFFLKKNYPTCFNNQDMMDTTCSASITGFMSLNAFSGEYVRSIEGIQYFKKLDSLGIIDIGLQVSPALPTGLTFLYCSNNELTSLPALPTGLIHLRCIHSSLTSLPKLPSGLIGLNCGGNELTSLPTLPSTLTELQCDNNELTSLPALPSALTRLGCYDNQLISLPKLPSGLIGLNCGDNELTSLPTLPSTLTDLHCDNNELTSLPTLPSALAYLSCNKNQLISLPKLPSELFQLYCSHNRLSSLPALPSTLTWFHCDNNNLTSFPVFGGHLRILDCSNNPKLSCLPILQNELMELDFSNTQITCLSNKFLKEWAPFPMCIDFNQICNGYSTLKGKVYLDTNNNDLHDSGEPIAPNFRLFTQSTDSVKVMYLSTTTGYLSIIDSLTSGVLLSNPYPKAFTVPISNYKFKPKKGESLVRDFKLHIATPNYTDFEISAYFIAHEKKSNILNGIVRNTGTTPINPRVVMHLPTAWTVDSLRPIGGIVKGDSVVWEPAIPFDLLEEHHFTVWCPTMTPLACFSEGGGFYIRFSVENLQENTPKIYKTTTYDNLFTVFRFGRDKCIRPRYQNE